MRNRYRSGRPASGTWTKWGRFVAPLMCLTLTLLPLTAHSQHAVEPRHDTEHLTTMLGNADRAAWWREARFGMFVHWGVYAIPSRGEWLMYQEHIPVQDYAKLAKQFHPKAYDPAKWVALAQAAGMKYVVLTTRHHDGYCLFDSRVSDFTSVKTGPKRDLVAEFANACRAAGMRIGFYYSLADWRFPGVLPYGVEHDQSVYLPMVEQAHAQVRELLTNYGKIDILWYDMLYPNDPELWRSRELNVMARELQPDILINDRAGLPEDFGTPENQVVAQERAWEACYTMNRTWGYAKYDRNYKPTAELIRLLASCAAQGGNLLLNVSPDADGRIPPEQERRLRDIGRWMRVNGEAIYGAVTSPVGAPALGLSSRVGDNVYLLLQRWPGSTLPFAWCGSRVASARLLATGEDLRVEQQGDRVWLRGLPKRPPDPYLNVVKLTFEGEPRPSEPPYK